MFLPLFDVDLEGEEQKKLSNLFTPVMTFIIVTCVLVFIYQSTLIYNINEFYQKWGTSVYKIINANEIGLEAYLSLITYSFVHGGIWHLLGNMWFFFIFGNNVERRMGTVIFIIFYFSSAIISALIHMYVLYPKEMLGQQTYFGMRAISQTNDIAIPLVGASGAISAVLGAYLKYFPRNYVITLVVFIIITTVSIPASVFIGIWLVGQIINALFSQQLGIAWFAHIGGFIYGYIFASLYRGKKEYRWQ
ncbi:MAG: rhomboid family intramembrane serine protease [Brevinematia bacterium]